MNVRARSPWCGSEERVLALSRLQSEVLVGEMRYGPSPRSAIQEADLHEERLVDLFDRVGFFGEGRRQRVHADGTTLVLVDDGQQQLAVDLVEAVLVHFE